LSVFSHLLVFGSMIWSWSLHYGVIRAVISFPFPYASLKIGVIRRIGGSPVSYTSELELSLFGSLIPFPLRPYPLTVLDYCWRLAPSVFLVHLGPAVSLSLQTANTFSSLIFLLYSCGLRSVSCCIYHEFRICCFAIAEGGKSLP
jgi:hypothetical protein